MDVRIDILVLAGNELRAQNPPDSDMNAILFESLRRS